MSIVDVVLVAAMLAPQQRVAAPGVAPTGGEGRVIRPTVEPGAGFRRELTFRPWSPFYILERNAQGTLALLGTTFAGCLDRGSGMPCEDRADAGVALSWRPRASPVSLFGGLVASSVYHPRSQASLGVTLIGGLLVTPPALVDLLKPRAARRR